MINLVGFMILYALADRFAGGGWPWLDAKLPGRGAFWAALACAGLGWLLGGLFAALGALAWLVWRTPAWKLFGGSATPQNSREIIGLGLRHLIIVPGFVLAAYWGHAPLIFSLGASLGFVLVATALAIALGTAVRRHIAEFTPLKDENTWTELARGAAFGLIVGLMGLAS